MLRFLTGITLAVLAGQFTASAFRYEHLDYWHCPYDMREGFRKSPIEHPYTEGEVPVDGWMAWAGGENLGNKNENTGKLFWSPISPFSPQVVPGTGEDVKDVHISTNGNWIVYSNRLSGPFEIVAVRPDGSGKTTIVPSSQNLFTMITIWRNSPSGKDEVVYYNSSEKKLYAVTVDFGENEALIGTPHVIAQGGSGGFDRAMAVSRDRIVTGIGAKQTCIVIPDNGNGTADISQHSFSEAPYANCGITMDFNGKWIAGNQGRADCLDPYRWNGKALHRGYTVLPFIEYDDADRPGDFEDWAYNYGIANNVVPARYKNGLSFSNNEFHHYYWTNDEDFIACIQQGKDAKHQGIWLSSWSSNEWFMLTPDGENQVPCAQPAVYIEPGIRLNGLRRMQLIDPEEETSLKASTTMIPDVAITEVRFFQDGVQIGSDTEAPYEHSVSGLSSNPPGEYTTFQVKAINGGAVVSTSPVVPVIVNEPRKVDSIATIVDLNRTVVAGIKIKFQHIPYDQYGRRLRLTADAASWDVGSAADIVETDANRTFLQFKETGRKTVVLTYTHNGIATSFEFHLTIISFPADGIKINLQPPADPEKECSKCPAGGYPTPEGYYSEGGDIPFNLRENGLVYGFDKGLDNQNGTRTVLEDCITPSDLTDAERSAWCTATNYSSWNMRIPDGNYLIKACGMNDKRKPGEHWFVFKTGEKSNTLEMGLNENYTDDEFFRVDSGVISVTDQVLMFSSSRAFAYPKANWLEIHATDSVPLGIAPYAPSAVLPANGLQTRIIPGKSIMITEPNSRDLNCRLLDVAGRTLIEVISDNSQSLTMETSELRPGMYVLQIRSPSGTHILPYLHNH